MEVGVAEVRKGDIQHVVYVFRCYEYYVPGTETTQHVYREEFHLKGNSETGRE